jgi:ATP-dependent helicase HrpB
MTKLPIEDILPQLRATLAAHSALVLQAPPGAGKTTLVPLALLDAPWLQGRTILMLEPRRLAARAAAARMAALLGEEVGETVGYRIRFETKISKRTRIEVLTEGILTRRLQNDQSLEGVGLVIFDEFHERHLHADLALALCLDSQRCVREDLKIIVMSATLDGAAVAGLLGQAPILTSVGRTYPVALHYRARDPSGPLPPVVSQAVRDALRQHTGDVLVFLPGAREIRQTQMLLQQSLAGDGIALHALYGDLPWEAQDRAIRPGGGQRKVVLATPIAETSLTIEGVCIVVDAGYARVPQFDPVSGLSRLHTQRISRASAEQRAGRAGRTAPGVCYRLWSESTQRGLVPHPAAEMRTADLLPLALELAHWGVRDVYALSWLDPPPAAALAQARGLLTQLGALDDAGVITAAGRAMAALPLHPRLAYMLHAAHDRGLGALACDLAALVSERDVLVGEHRRSADFVERLEVLQRFRQTSRAKPAQPAADPAACARADKAAQQWRRLLGAGRSAVDNTNDSAGVLLAMAYPDRVALQRAPGEARYHLSSGRGARLPEHELRMRQPCLVAVNLDAGNGEGLIYQAVAVDVECLRVELADHLRWVDIVAWDGQQEAVIARREQRLGELVLDSAPLDKPEAAKRVEAMLTGLRRMGLEALPWTPEAREWQARVLSVRAWFPDEAWPDVSDPALLQTLEQWLAPFLAGITRRAHLARLDLPAALRSQLDWQQNSRLDELAPTHIGVPSGARHRLDYSPGQSPVLAVKLQEMFGLADTPRIAAGRIPVTLHLLSPARRPIQVTQDLRGFWERTYAEVKKELKGRYPRHPWPDDPWNATPTARIQRRPK